MNDKSNSVELRPSKKVMLLFFLVWFMMAFMGGAAWHDFVFKFLGFSKILTVSSWALICGVAFIIGHRYLQTFRIEANDSEVTYRFGTSAKRFAWNQISTIVSEPMLNGFNKVVGNYPALKGSDGTILVGIDPSAWGSSEDREIFVAFVKKKLANTP